MCSLCWLPVAQNHNFGQILTFGGSCTDPLLPIRSNLVRRALEETHGVRYVPNFVSIGLFLSPSGSDKTQVFPFFGLRHFVVSPIGSSLRKLDTDANFPLSNGIKIISVLQRLHGEMWCKISDVQKRDGQTDKQTDKLETVSIAEPLQNRQHAQNP